MAPSLTKKKAIVLGASGQIGWYLLPRLVAAGAQVLAVSRKGRPKEYPVLPSVDWVHSEALVEFANDTTVLLSAGPLGLALDVLEHMLSIEKVVAFSTTSVLSKLESPDPQERALVTQIAQSEWALFEVCKRNHTPLCLLRPTLIYGCGLDANVSRLARLIRWLPWLPIAGEASGKRQPVHADDLAAAAVSALFADHALPGELTLCGGSTVTYLEMLRRIARASGQPLRTAQLPEGLMTFGIRALRMLPGFTDLSPAMAHRQNQDLVFDDSLARELIGFRPRPFEPAGEDLVRPRPDRIMALAKASAQDGD